MNKTIDEIDKIFLDYFSKNQEIPSIVENRIKSTLVFESKNNKIILIIKKIIAIIIGLFTITGSIVFANDIKNFISNLFKYNVGSGITTAIDNDYVQKYDLNYCESNGVRVDVDSVIMDDANLDIAFKINLEKTQDISLISNIYFSDFIIRDEENRILFSEFDNIEKYQQFCKENNLSANYKNVSYSNGAYSSTISRKNDYDVYFTYNINSNQFPKSKKLYISFDKITLAGETNQNIYEIYEGYWNIGLELPEKFYNRKTTNYEIYDSNDSNIKIDKFMISNTCTKVQLQTKVSKEIVDIHNNSLIPIIYIKDEYIENEDGIKYYPQGINDGDGGYSISDDGILNYWQTFELTQFNLTEKLKIVLKTYDDKEIVINLKKVE